MTRRSARDLEEGISKIMPAAFVTGATGFVGGAVARELIRRDWNVRVLVRQGSDARNIEALERSASPGQVERRVADLRDPASLGGALEGCDHLFHVAARYSLWNPRPAEIYRDNVEGTRNILEAARQQGVRKVVHTSTVGTIHIPADGRPGDETRSVELAELRGHYKRSKLLSEQEARRFAADGLPVTIVHPSAPVGAADPKPTPTGRMIVDFLHGKIRAYASTGLNVVDVDDVARGHLLAAERGEVGQSYILGAENLPLLDIFRILADLSDIPPPRVRLPGAVIRAISLGGELVSRVTRRPPFVPWEAVAMSHKLMYFDSTRARKELGYEPGPARRALARAVQWFYENNYASPLKESVLERLREEIDPFTVPQNAAS